MLEKSKWRYFFVYTSGARSQDHILNPALELKSLPIPGLERMLESSLRIEVQIVAIRESDCALNTLRTGNLTMSNWALTIEPRRRKILNNRLEVSYQKTQNDLRMTLKTRFHYERCRDYSLFAFNSFLLLSALER